ncbi:unnamed protein product [Zymoseptoria tritici ST99CH_1A5]|uniref:PPM-type phosphatase domain-containing protein n=1 Tax=Zymoseptoria tritici ST99CH_1A5 TaxID=1276529 RepID=A0A1Y6L675_ZYMTR|nr:unnamed protein product [Zymoseptoria tritici ST99CH_1A5]
MSAGVVLGIAAYGKAMQLRPIELVEINGAKDDEGQLLQEAMIAGVHEGLARRVPPMSYEDAMGFLRGGSGYSVTPKAVSHFTQAPSNLPCEDTMGSGTYTFLGDPAKDWSEWGIFDGHAGSRTAQLLKDYLPLILGEALWKARCMTKPVEQTVVQTIKSAFLKVDQEIVEGAGNQIQAGGSLPQIVAAGAAAFSGSCALVAIFDPVREVVRVANVGDSRAVLGRWDPISKKYVAEPMSVDQTGFNSNEVDRVTREHPGEDPVDPKAGRIYGLAVSRAFGDARWKWTEELTKLAHDKYFGPAPRPNEVIKTPPYLTAEPEVMTCSVASRGSDPAPFLIMGSDGLWDQMSSEDAVTCVQMWLDKFKPTDFLDVDQSETLAANPFTPNAKRTPPTFTSAADLADDDTWFDEDEKCLKWKAEPKHFVVEDENCAVHVAQNALGGKRRDLFAGVMSVQAPYSRNVRDDITVNVIFFGVDASTQMLEAKRAGAVVTSG